MRPTDAQRAALEARGNVLVVAGAGTGKTRTLVERCCALLLDEGCSLDELLMVTFTDAAAAEMRRRIHARLLQKLEADGDPRVEEQLALLDTAHISTLHGFCLKLIREHFHHEKLRLDPEFAILTEEQTHQLRLQTLDDLFEERYRDVSRDGGAFRALVARQAGGNEARVRELVWRLHRHAQSLADPERWFAEQIELFSASEPVKWREWFVTGFGEWRECWLEVLRAQSPDNTPAHTCAETLETVTAGMSASAIAGVLETILAADATWPNRRKTALRKPIEKFFDEAAFLHSLAPAPSEADPLAQDWEWSREPMLALVRLAREFGERFARAKREAGGVDFSDLEQFALRLLWDAGANEPTEVAREWRARLKFVFVDEYQDINGAQDMILRAVSREGAEANRFLVGDVKQSIYRFRLANPTIFQTYKKQWENGNGAGSTIPLSHNFRSRAALLEFVNPLFASLMREEIGGVVYDEAARLQFGAPEQRAALSSRPDDAPSVEIHLVVKGSGDEANSADAESAFAPGTELADLESAEREARLVALRLRNLHRSGLTVWDDDAKAFRAVEWRDMVVLLRAPRSKAEAFAKEFSRIGVPLHATRGGFYDTTEISDLLCLLQLLDNPLQDIPLLSVLRSPIAGFSLDELAAIRALNRHGNLWHALRGFHQAQTTFDGEMAEIVASARARAGAFLTSFDAWRSRVRQAPLSDCLEGILAETHYETLLRAQERGEERLANVRRFLKLARQFDPFQRQGLFRFLKFVEAQRDADAEEEPSVAPGANSVRLMSIHQSKGLEFPVVVVADLGKCFNTGDLNADILLDAKYGLCPRVAPPHRRAQYPSLPYWLARRRQLAEALGEELRLLYVALTRARDRLILTGNTTQRSIETWREGNASTITARDVLGARACLAWLQSWLASETRAGDWENDLEGGNHLAQWTLYSENDARLRRPEAPVAESGPAPAPPMIPDDLTERLMWSYPNVAGTVQPAKTSVTGLRRQSSEEEDEAAPLFRPRLESTPARRARSKELSAAEIGIAHHKFLELVALEHTGAFAELRAEAKRLETEGTLTPRETAALNLNAIAAFFATDFGVRIRAHAQHARRELAFTARFSPDELARLMNRSPTPELAHEFLVVQGIADLVVLLPDAIWLVDFKTDDFAPAELSDKLETYGPQLKLYARALSRIYRRPVTECQLHFLLHGITSPVELGSQ